MKKSIMKCKNDSEPAGEQMTLFSLAGSLDHASPTAQPESGSERKMNAIYGPKCLEQYGKFNHVGSWAKMFSALLIGTGDWYSKRCKLTWKLKGTKYNRLYFQLQASTLPTNGTEFGLLPTKMLPTPNASDFIDKQTSKSWKEKGATNYTLGNPEIRGLLLTPTTREEVVDLDKFKKRMEKYPNGTTMPNLATQVMGLLPTPTAQEFRDSQLTPEQAKKLDKGGRVLRRLGTLDLLEAGTTSQLNPRFVLEMMGFPPNWTELPFLSGETNQSRPPETQSCPK